MWTKNHSSSKSIDRKRRNKSKHAQNEFRLVKKRAKKHSQCDIAIDMREEFFYPTYWRRVVFVCFLDMCRSNINAFMRTEKQVTQNDRK
jgi:hypothetical protein